MWCGIVAYCCSVFSIFPSLSLRLDGIVRYIFFSSTLDFRFSTEFLSICIVAIIAIITIRKMEISYEILPLNHL